MVVCLSELCEDCIKLCQWYVKIEAFWSKNALALITWWWLTGGLEDAQRAALLEPTQNVW
jgi:hypothetical protein